MLFEAKHGAHFAHDAAFLLLGGRWLINLDLFCRQLWLRCVARIALVIMNWILDVASPACPVFAYISTIKRVVVFIVINFLINRWKPIANLAHDCVKMTFDDFSQCRLLLLEVDKATADDKLAAHIILNEVEPVLLGFLVKSLE